MKYKELYNLQLHLSSRNIKNHSSLVDFIIQKYQLGDYPNHKKDLNEWVRLFCIIKGKNVTNFISISVA
jgi:hypothetical protein